MRKLLSVGLLVFAAALVVAIWLFAPWPPKPVEQRISPEATFDPWKYHGSMPQQPGQPEILILGSMHFAQRDHSYRDEEFDDVVEALALFAPDMVAVEYLPADYPEGKGRDYRPDLAIDERAEEWNLEQDRARELLDEWSRSTNHEIDPCQIGRAHLVNRDLMNALYQWLHHDCPEVERHEAIAEWAGRYGQGETVRIAFEVARRQGLERIESIDYQGDDARWFIHEPARELIEQRRYLTLVREFWPILPHIGTMPRANRRHYLRFEDDLAAHLHHMNSPEHIGYQYWTYEEVYPRIGYEDAGSRQTANYWLRNERMFESLEAAMEREQPDRVLVTVGSGHKYFLDELAGKAGYRWIDPREWLPPLN